VARTGDYEIERKYLLRGLPPLPAGARVLRIDQGYIPGRRLRERVRRTRERERTSYFRTIKFGSGIKRLEIEEETTADIFRTLWRLTRGKRIRKLRYVVEDCGTWEIDRFIGFDLALAEIELEHEDESITFPAWLEPLLEREVTGDPAFTNFSLAR
jgi:CYTH domain-containing protein